MSIYFEKARELGELILNSDEAKKLQRTSEELSGNKEIIDKINAFSAYRERVAAEISDNSLSPAETEAKSAELMKKFEELNSEPVIRAQREADNEYEALINKVTDILNLTLGRNVTDSHGGCEGCGGCGKN